MSVIDFKKNDKFEKITQEHEKYNKKILCILNNKYGVFPFEKKLNKKGIFTGFETSDKVLDILEIKKLKLKSKHDFDFFKLILNLKTDGEIFSTNDDFLFKGFNGLNEYFRDKNINIDELLLEFNIEKENLENQIKLYYKEQLIENIISLSTLPREKSYEKMINTMMCATRIKELNDNFSDYCPDMDQNKKIDTDFLLNEKLTICMQGAFHFLDGINDDEVNFSLEILSNELSRYFLYNAVSYASGISQTIDMYIDVLDNQEVGEMLISNISIMFIYLILSIDYNLEYEQLYDEISKIVTNLYCSNGSYLSFVDYSKDEKLSKSFSLHDLSKTIFINYLSEKLKSNNDNNSIENIIDEVEILSETGDKFFSGYKMPDNYELIFKEKNFFEIFPEDIEIYKNFKYNFSKIDILLGTGILYENTNDFVYFSAFFKKVKENIISLSKNRLLESDVDKILYCNGPQNYNEEFKKFGFNYDNLLSNLNVSSSFFESNLQKYFLKISKVDYQSFLKESTNSLIQDDSYKYDIAKILAHVLKSTSLNIDLEKIKESIYNDLNNFSIEKLSTSLEDELGYNLDELLLTEENFKKYISGDSYIDGPVSYFKKILESISIFGFYSAVLKIDQIIQTPILNYKIDYFVKILFSMYKSLENDFLLNNFYKELTSLKNSNNNFVIQTLLDSTNYKKEIYNENINILNNFLKTNYDYGLNELKNMFTNFYLSESPKELHNIVEKIYSLIGIKNN